MSRYRVVVEDEATGERVRTYAGLPASLVQKWIAHLDQALGVAGSLAMLKKGLEGLLPTAPTAHRRSRR